MRTKCPFCDFGCKKCEDGFFESNMGDGVIFTEECTNRHCRFVNSVKVVGPDTGTLPEGQRRCIFCKTITKWELYGWSAPDPVAPSSDEPEGFLPGEIA